MRERPSAEVNSVMMRPQPDCWLVCVASTSVLENCAENWLAFLMKRRKTVSVTPAIGARTVAGAIFTLPMVKLAGGVPAFLLESVALLHRFFAAFLAAFFAGLRRSVFGSEAT